MYTWVQPGITGMWQVSGRSDTTYITRVHLDEYYVRNWSIWLDIYILSYNFGCVLKKGCLLVSFLANGDQTVDILKNFI